MQDQNLTGKVSTWVFFLQIFCVLFPLSSRAGYAQTVYVTSGMGISAVDSSQQSVLTTIPVSATFLTMSQDGSRLYASAFNGLDVIDTSTNAILTTVPVGANPFESCLSPDGRRLYVAHFDSSSVFVIDTSNNSIISTISVPGNPIRVAISPDASRVYVSTRFNGVAVLDPMTNTIVHQVSGISAGALPLGISFLPDGSRAYIGEFGGPIFYVVDARSDTLIQTVTISGADGGLSGIVTTPDGSRLYLTNIGTSPTPQGTHGVFAVDSATNTVIARILVGGANQIAISSDGSKVFVGDSALGNLDTIDVASNSVVASVHVSDLNLITGVATKPPEKNKSIWPMSGHDPQRTGLSPFTGPKTSVGPSWTFTSGGPVIGDLVISAEGIIYFSSEEFYALNPDGTPYVPAAAVEPLTTPVIDDANGFVYVIVRNAFSGYDLIQYSKQLQNPVVVFHGAFEFNVIVPTSLIIGSDGTVYFSDGVSVIAAGPRNWRSPGQPFFGPCFGNPGLLTPTLGRDGSVYSMCQSGGGSGFGSGIYRFDGNTGAQTAFAAYSRGGTELIIDAQNNIRAGYQAFNGATFTGSYDNWDTDLNQLTTTSLSDFTTSRSALIPDGFSTVRIGFSFQSNELDATGAHIWGVPSGPQTLPNFSTVPTIDASGNVFVGTASGVAALSGIDGSTIWFSSLTDTISTQPALSQSGTVVVGSNTGKIYAFAARPAIPKVVVSPLNISFGGQLIGTSSTPQTVTITNGGDIEVQLFSISVPRDFSEQSTCNTTLSPKSSCTISVSFVPHVGGSVQGTMIITDNTPNGSEQVALTGLGILPPQLGLSSAQLTFNDQPVGFASSAMTVDLINTGGQTLDLSLSIIGDFQQNNNCATSLLPGASCTALITFMPTATGTRTGALIIMDNAQGSPHSVALSGAGIPAIGRPILFVHGFCSTPEGWSAMELDLFLRLRQQYPTLYTNPGVYEASTDGSSVDWIFNGKKPQQKEIAQTARFFTIRFSDPRTNDPNKKFDTTNVADVPIAVKGNELAQVLQSIRQITGQQDVIVIAHSMGGLVARAYMENLASPPTSCSKDGLVQFTPGTTSYASDISQLITLDTPHSGSEVDAWIPVPFSCFRSNTVNRVEMLPSSEGGEFIGTLNYLPGFSYNGSIAAPLPPQAQYVAIKSYTILTAVPTLVFWDDILRDTEQDMAAALVNSSSPKIETVENFFADVPPDLACRPANIAHVLHLLGCVGAQKQTLDRVWNVTHASIFGRLAGPFNIQPGRNLQEIVHSIWQEHRYKKVQSCNY